MMTNLFSIFDPKIMIFNLELNWLAMPITLLIFLNSYWLATSPNYTVLKKSLLTLEKEIQLNFTQSPNPGLTHLIVSLFSFLLLMNFMGLTPYTFTPSSHLSVSLTLALFSWISYFMWIIVKDLNQFLSHLVPTGTPYPLMPLLVLIELTSNIIRPITLSVRLAANMVAGHLLLTLIASPITPFGNFFMNTLLTVVVLMMMLENAVSIIQAYVFSMLSSLYISEANSSNYY